MIGVQSVAFHCLILKEKSFFNKWNYTVHTSFLLYTGYIFTISFLLLLYVSIILVFMCYLVCYFWDIGKLKIFSIWIKNNCFFNLHHFDIWKAYALLSDSGENLYKCSVGKMIKVVLEPFNQGKQDEQWKKNEVRQGWDYFMFLKHCWYSDTFIC